MNPENFGANLKQLLDELDLSQSEFARRAGLSQAAVSQILNNEREPSLQTICKILTVIPTTFERLVKTP
jgi:transcriptional regulator with XRE-family HTH domain